MQISSNMANNSTLTGMKVAGAASSANTNTNHNAESAKNEKKDSKNISMADSELIQNSNRVENIIKRFEKQKELVRNQIDNVNKNQQLTVDEKKEKVTELTDKIKMLEDEKTAAIFEENQKKIEEERRKREEQQEKKEVKEKANNEAPDSEGVKDMEHLLKIGQNYSRISRFKQTKAEMERAAGRVAGEIANDIMASGVTASYTEAKIKAAAGVNPYRDNDWKIKHYHKLTTGIANLDNAIKNENKEINRESKKYGEIKVEYAKEDNEKETDETVKAAESSEVVTEGETQYETKPETEAAGQNEQPQEQEKDEKQENKVVNEAHSKYKKTDGKNIDKKGSVIDTDL